MVSFISLSGCVLLLLVSTNNLLLASADTCQGDDPLSCKNGGQCRNGIKDYQNLLSVPSNDELGMIERSKRGMYCECQDDQPTLQYGMSGLHCGNEFQICADESICFNGGLCERDSQNRNKYHCGCPQDETNGDIWAGKTCENKATDFCSTNDPFYNLAGSRWFCVNDGVCVNGVTDLSKKCNCPEGTFGLHCEYDDFASGSCDLKCFNGGECKKGAKDLSEFIDYGLDIDEFLQGSNIAGEHCVCPNGFSGVQCNLEESKNDFRHCGSGVCFNGGLCVKRVSEVGSLVDYHCECNEFETNVAGEFCEHDEVTFCPFPEGHDGTMYYCANGGDCPIGEPHESCTNCNDGWSGPRCEIRLENKATVEERNDCDLDCKNGGSCFFGDHPIQDATLQSIPGLEFLQDNKHCRCPSGYIGLRCEMRYERCGAGEHYCLHGSGCVSDNDQFTCDCNEVSTSLVAYAGHYCEHTAEEFCEGPGAGKHSFCTEHGTCRGEIGIGQDHVGCDCQEGWDGNFCEYQLAQLRTDGIATKLFVGFIGTVIGIILITLGYWLYKGRSNDRNMYETAYAHEMHANPYGDEHDDSSDDDEDEEEYELKEVRIT